MLAGIRNTHAKPPRPEAVLPKDVIAMIETVDRGALRGLRDCRPAACAAQSSSGSTSAAIRQTMATDG